MKLYLDVLVSISVDVTLNISLTDKCQAVGDCLAGMGLG